MSHIDHETCGHVNHVTLDGSRHEEMHTAVFDLIQKWSHERDCVQDLVDAMHPFEIEQ